MKLILMGTSSWVIPVFDRMSNEHDIVAVFTRAPKPAGRNRELQKSPVHLWAESRNIPVHTNIKDFDRIVNCPPTGARNSAADSPQGGSSMLSATTPPLGGVAEPRSGDAVGGQIDAIVVASYGVILRDNVLNAARLGCINIHPSALPKYRGPSPMATAIYNGDRESAVCLMRVVAAVDSGDVFMRRPFSIGENDTNGTIEKRVGEMSAEMLSEFLAAPEKFPPMPQVGEPTYTRKFTGDDEKIDWSKTPEQIHNQIRAIGGRTKINGIDVKILETRLPPVGGEYPRLRGGGGASSEKKNDIKVENKNLSEEAPPRRPSDDTPPLRGGDASSLQILRLQPAGKKPMEWKAFINGLRGAEVIFGK